MARQPHIPTQRMEALSDGVIAILLTVMVFDLKFTTQIDAGNIAAEMGRLLPKLLSYATSFLMVAVMWVNHHQIFHQVRHAGGQLLWHNLHLLFWMSLVPFGTHFIGSSPMMPLAACLYGGIFFLNALSFTLLRHHVIRRGLLHDTVPVHRHRSIQRKNLVTLLIYLTAMAMAWVSVWISYALFLLVPARYFVPEKIGTVTNNDPPR